MRITLPPVEDSADGSNSTNRAGGSDPKRWHLAQHARIIVYEAADGGELLTIYDCAAAQKPPSAQIRGNLVRVRARHEHTVTPTGYLVDLREPALLVRQDETHWRVDPADSRRP